MDFKICSFSELKSKTKSSSYAGGSTADSLDNFKSYINNSNRFGNCNPTYSSVCYYAEVSDVESKENELISQGFSCNINKESNVTPNKSGYVYVVINLS